MKEEEIKGKIPIMSFYFGPVDVGWIYIEPPHFEIRTFKRAAIDFDPLTDYYPDLIIMNLHLKRIRYHFSDSYILKVHSKDVKEAFRYNPPEFEPYKEYFDRLVASIYVSTTESIKGTAWVLGGYKCSPVELKTLKQLVYALHILEMSDYPTYPLLVGEET